MTDSETINRRSELRTIAQNAVTEAIGADVTGFQMVDSEPLVESLHVDVLTDDEHELVTLWRTSDAIRPTTSAFILSLVRIHAKMAEQWKAHGERVYADPLALEHAVTNDVLKTIDPLSAAGPQEEHLLACYRAITAKQQSNLLHGATIHFQARLDGIDDVTHLDFGTSLTTGRDPLTVAGQGQMVLEKAKDMLERGEYLRPR